MGFGRGDYGEFETTSAPHGSFPFCLTVGGAGKVMYPLDESLLSLLASSGGRGGFLRPVARLARSERCAVPSPSPTGRARPRRPSSPRSTLKSFRRCFVAWVALTQDAGRTPSPSTARRRGSSSGLRGSKKPSALVSAFASRQRYMVLAQTKIGEVERILYSRSTSTSLSIEGARHHRRDRMLYATSPSRSSTKPITFWR